MSKFINPWNVERSTSGYIERSTSDDNKIWGGGKNFFRCDDKGKLKHGVKKRDKNREELKKALEEFRNATLPTIRH